MFVVPVSVVPVPCTSQDPLRIGSEVSADQDPILLVPVFVTPVELLSCQIVELVPEFVVPVLFPIGDITLQLSSIVVR